MGDSAQLPLLERVEELEAVESALARARDGAGSLIVVEGRPGLGKSRLIAAAAASSGVRVLSARGDGAERDFAFGVALQLFERAAAAEPLDGAAAFARPLFEGDAEGRAPMPLLHGLYWLTANLAEAGPLLLTVDDADRADQPSLRFLHYLVQRIEELPAVVLVSSAPNGSRPAPLAELAANPSAAVRSLEPLSAAAVADAVHAVLDHADPPFCAACAQVTGGNPFLLAELVAELQVEGIAATAASVERVRELTPDALARRIGARLARLGPDAVTFARALAVLRDSAPLRAVARVAGLDRAAARTAADVLVAADLLTADADALAFAQPLVRSAVYAGIEPARRAELHGLAAAALRDDGEPPDRVAGQLLDAPRDADPEAVAMLRRAAERSLARGAPAAAADYLRRALAEPPPAELRPALAAELARAEALAGAPDSVTSAGGAARVLTPSELRIARMAADGMKNREIAEALLVTVKAVEFHLANAYRKLEVKGRGELAPALG